MLINKNSWKPQPSRVLLAQTVRFELTCGCPQTDFESSCQNRTWRNLTEDNGKCENPENAMFSRLSAPVHIENAVKIRARKSLPISSSSNGFSEKPIRIIDRTERFFAPKSRFWQCVKSTGYAGLHPKSCRKMGGVESKLPLSAKIYVKAGFERLIFCR